MKEFLSAQPSTAWSPAGQTRTVVAANHALIAPDGHVPAPLAGWGNHPGVVLISPAMGAALVQSQIAVEPGTSLRRTSAPGIEALVYVLSGTVNWGEGAANAGSYLFLPAGENATIEVEQPGALLCFEKRFVPPGPEYGGALPQRLTGHVGNLESRPFLGDPDACLQLLLPDEPEWDMAVNVFTYQTGARLPFVETHIMEHGLTMLYGEGIYRLDNQWYPVFGGDSIWMAPYCPQWFAAIGKGPAAYIYYKDVNRDPAAQL